MQCVTIKENQQTGCSVKEWMRVQDKWHKRLLEIFFPPPCICPICKTKQPQLKMCADCAALLAQKRRNHGQCGRCGTYGVRAGVCDNCRDWPAYLVGNHSALPYEGNFRQAVLDFKYRGQPWMAQGLAEMMLPLVPEEAEILIPVPLHPNRLRQRGFNQSALLAKALAEQTGLPMTEQALLRIADTPHQTGLSRSKRRQNLQQAFAVGDRMAIAGRHVLLIDDVLTTGTTIAQCAQVLHQAGARQISSLTIASGMK